MHVVSLTIHRLHINHITLQCTVYKKIRLFPLVLLFLFFFSQFILVYHSDRQLPKLSFTFLIMKNVQLTKSPS